MSGIEEIDCLNHDKAYLALAKISQICELKYRFTGEEELRNEGKSCKELCRILIDLIPVNFTKVFRDLLGVDGDIDYQIPTKSPVRLYKPEILGFTALHFAVVKCNYAALNSLLELGADMTKQSFDGFTALRLAVQRSRQKARKCFDLRGRVEHPLADFILDAQVKAEKSANPRCKSGVSHFHIACMLNHEKAVEFFLENGECVNARVSSDSDILPGYTPLHFAARYCSVDVIKILRKYGAHGREKDAKGLTPLHLLVGYKMQMADELNQEQLKRYNSLQVDLEKVNCALQLLTCNAKHPSAALDDQGLTYLHLSCTEMKTAIEESSLRNVGSNLVNAAIDFDSSFCPGYTPLHFAAHFNLQTFNVLLKQGADISAKDAKGTTPFDICVRKYDADDLRAILASQAALANIRFSSGDKLVDAISSKTDAFLRYLENVIDKNVSLPPDSPIWPGCNLLHVAVYLAKFPKVETLFAQVDHSKSTEQTTWEEDPDVRVRACIKYGVNITTQNSDGASPLHLAFWQGKKTIVPEIVRHHSFNGSDPLDRHGLSHLHIACKENRHNFTDDSADNPIVDYFSPLHINRQVESELHYNGCRFAAGSTPLHMAVISGNHKMVKILLDNGADPSIKNAEGMTPIHLSPFPTCMCTFINDLKFLQENTIADGGFSNLHAACYDANLAGIEKLLKLGADVNLPITGDYSRYEFHPPFLEIGYTPLHLAVLFGRKKAVELLMSHGANIGAKSKTGMTPLHLATETHPDEYGEEEAREVRNYFFTFLQNLDPNYTDEMGLTLLHLACAAINKKAVNQLLIGGSSNVNAQIDSGSPVFPGCTPLHVLINTEYVHDEDFDDKLEIARLLLLYGADVTITNANYETPVHACFYKEDVQVRLVSLLMENQKSYKINPVNGEGVSHFHLACLAKETTIVEKFLKDGVDVNLSTDYFRDEEAGYTAVHYSFSQTNLVDILIKYGVDLNARDVAGSTPLHIAIKGGSTFTRQVEYLLSTGKVDVNARTLLGHSPLELLFTRYIWQDQFLNILKVCLSQGGLVNVYNPVTSVGLLGTLMERNSRSSEKFETRLKIILEEASDVCTIDPVTGKNAIHNIVSVQFVENNRYEYAIRELMKLRVELERKDEHGKTPLHTAVQYRNVIGVRALLALGVDVNIVDLAGKTAFHYNEKLSVPCDEISRLFGIHLRNLGLLGLEVDVMNKSLLDNLRSLVRSHVESYMVKSDASLLRGIHVIDETFTLRDFLTEEAVADYPTMPKAKREAIDDFVRTKQDFNYENNMGYLVNLQYRKAEERVKMMEPAKNVIDMLVGFHMRDPCSEHILRYLRNSDLKTLIELLRE